MKTSNQAEPNHSRDIAARILAEAFGLNLDEARQLVAVADAELQGRRYMPMGRDFFRMAATLSTEFRCCQRHFALKIRFNAYP
ncbi:hypothetical protein [Dyella caseinilytica]|uniref:Uncharacterized protein n=1 Tax=Dyella caseinilytica TaxID=1849581 RepID=A0ABX7GPR8_9GAMM|nr:hypothetical protein [Dyella caseinilytica]QRN52417.1 hypothetical protein ISN74_13120 [Dyella caseinilytica]